MTWLRILLLIGLVSPASFLLKENWYFIFPIITALLAIFKRSQTISHIALLTILGTLLIFSFTHSLEIRSTLSRNPGTNYATDMRAYLKTLYLLNEGESFYPALSKGFHQQQSALPPDIWGWKQPLIFYIWHIAGNPGNVWFLGLINFALFLIAAYLANKKYLGAHLALLSPLLVFPYFLYPMTGLPLLLVEWWAITLFMIAICLRIYNHKVLAFTFFLLTLAIREYFVVPILLFSLYDLIPIIKAKKLYQLAPYALLSSIFCAYYFGIHLNSLISLGEGTTARGFNPGSLSYFNLPLAFVSWNYLLGPKRLFMFLLIVGSIVSLRRIKELSLVVLAFLPMALFVLGASLIGVLTPWHDYWGILFMPMVLAFLPTIVLSSQSFDK